MRAAMRRRCIPAPPCCSLQRTQQRILHVAENILLVDDEADFLEILSERIIARGMAVTTADSAAAALDRLSTGTYDAIVLDLMMPGMDGIEALNTIKTRHPGLEVILLTGHATIEKGIEAMKLGALDFIEKPADLDKLTGIIKKAKARKVLLTEKAMEDKMKQVIGRKGW